MRILFVTGDHPTEFETGYLRLTRDIVAILSAFARVEMVALGSAFPSPAEGLGEVPVHTLRPGTTVGGKRWKQLLLLGSPLPMLRAAYAGRYGGALKAVFSNFKPDLIIFNHLRGAWLLASTNFHVPTMYIAHNAEAATQRSLADLRGGAIGLAMRIDAWKLQRLEARVLARADAAVALTNEDAVRLTDLQPSSRVNVIPPPVALPDLGARSARTDVLLVGSFRWEPKRQNAVWLATEVMPLVRRVHPGAVLRVVGQDSELLRPALNGPLTQAIGRVDDLRLEYEGTKVFAVPERQLGGIKLKTVEAASWGVPIVSTPAGIEGTFLERGISCLVAEDSAGFANHLIRLLGDPRFAASMGDAARQATMRAFNPKLVGAAYHDLADSLIRGNK